ncbi:hypothetical protein BDN72DRAFT_830310 [Pluteus cervinus]|uniref:Uncharacterized protein n=1 Tax=Pluteus cervinus TaxID=181527 RepID=A0ACD3BGX6_9AGAR|nr:hypothetical protein BDN72DRAFT_830310 [Pluteus cervinus]
MNHFVATFLLNILHFFYSLFSARKSRNTPPPSTLSARRARVPTSLAVLFATDSHSSHPALQASLVESVSNLVAWCRTTGIPKLIVYDQHGILSQSSQAIRERVAQPSESIDSDSSESDFEYPLTPPPSDYSDSRPLSPENVHDLSVITIAIPSKKHRKDTQKYKAVLRKRQPKSRPPEPPLTLYISSRASGKGSIASVARSLVSLQAGKPPGRGFFRLPVESLDSLLDSETNMPCPELLVVVQTCPSQPKLPVELHGFPPWQIRLTEIHTCRTNTSNTLDGPPVLLDEHDFCEALDGFETVEQRFGK